MSDRTKDFILEVVQRARTTIEQTNFQATELVSTTTDLVNSALDRTTSQAIESFKQVKTQTVNSISSNTEKAKETLDRVVAATVDNVDRATENAKLTLEDNLHKADSFNSFIAENIQAAVRSSIDNWISQHPIAGWLITHPLISLLLFFFIIFLLLGLLKAVALLVEKTGLIILRSPLLLSKFIFRFGAKESQKAAVDRDNKSEQFKTILEKLDAIEKEQQLILQELAELRNRNI